MKKLSWCVYVGLLLVLLTSCNFGESGIFERRVRVVGEISSFGQENAITLPKSVQSGESFEITVITLGGGCMEQGETEVEVQGLQADITPYDYRIIPPAGTACPLYGEDYPHTVGLSFAEKGTATLLFHGIKSAADKDIETTETRTLTVR